MVGSVSLLGMDTMGSRIKAAREARPGMSQGKLATEFGINRVSVSNWETNETRPDPDKLPRLAELLQVDLKWLMEGKGRAPAPLPQAPARPVGPRRLTPGIQAGPDRDLPLYAAAMGGEGHVIVTFDPIDWVKRPDRLDRVKDGYGILIVGNSMSPAYREGDIALIHPHLPPAHDSDVVLYRVPPVEDAEAIIKHLVSWDDRRWRLEQYDPAKQFAEMRAHWQVCHRVVGRYNAR